MTVEGKEAASPKRGAIRTHSPLKGMLAEGIPTLGSWITIDSIMVAEILAKAGFDWIVIDQEHTAIDAACAKAQMIAIQAHDVEVLIRVAALNEVEIKKALDCGADGVIVPMIKTADDVRAALNWSYYPPVGSRGVGLHRAQGYGPGFARYLERMKHGLVVIAQIEHTDAVANIDSILAVKGLDGVMIGPYDLSASLGFPGDFDHPQFRSALDTVIAACRKRKTPFGFHSVNSDSAQALSRLRDGATFIAYGVDFLFLFDSASRGLAELREHLT